jgi:hypothetical protein
LTGSLFSFLSTSEIFATKAITTKSVIRRDITTKQRKAGHTYKSVKERKKFKKKQVGQIS